MRIQLDRKKYKRRVISLLLLTIAFATGTILIPVMGFSANEELSVKGIVFTIIFGLFTFLFAYTTLFYFSIRNLENAFVYENGELSDYSKPFNKARGVKRDDIKSITLWSDNRKINQYILIKKNFTLGGNAIVHQLKGNHIYLSDYVVDSEELRKLVQLIESELKTSES